VTRIRRKGYAQGREEGGGGKLKSKWGRINFLPFTHQGNVSTFRGKHMVERLKATGVKKVGRLKKLMKGDTVNNPKTRKTMTKRACNLD